ncbi:efflux RND transporter periplasmic adaptor subunit [Amphiplicatus metriothermophilus]|uniref:Membrane fusion protein, multidrug efflux system n=1 Tax=Amphiplicatus metriothermophilus TaxID=1519374 RepID=A0A239PQM4_9PROT|nr:efflux RND transporter periplasmic adaptor subunit [Amphiplicatus metriothermophilus]MBB5518410.1 membrane fusion protein (multidrug efflux system) [Amphiplicatus metriothermophilus]SNT72428.1 membrane fusion protein, multidrug efflux system [Amphiplicatus metriothermophilus]
MSLFSRRFYKAAGAGTLALLAVACAGEAQEGMYGQAGPPEVAVESVKARPVRLTSVLPGRTVAYRVAEVRPQVSGVITERLFEEGDEVDAGQPLYRIDSAPYQAAFENAAAALARAEALAVAAANREKRLARLVETNAVSRQDYDDAVAAARQARADVAAARAARDSAKVDLDRTVVAAPIAGRIGRALVTDGALVSAGQAQPLAVIHTLDPIYVDIAQSSAEILRWKRRATDKRDAGDAESFGVKLTLEDGFPYPLEGRLELTEVSVEPSTGSVAMRAVFPNPDGLLLPGMFVRAEVVEGMLDEAILAPQRAITRNPQGQGVAYVVDAENRAEARIVETERAIGDQWVVTAGLEPGDRLVVEGFQRFRPGDPVTPVEVSRVAAAGSESGANAPGGGRP